jgi:hypothetical protein
MEEKTKELILVTTKELMVAKIPLLSGNIAKSEIGNDFILLVTKVKEAYESLK